MALAGLFVDDSAVEADLHGLAIVTLLGRHEFDPAVAVPVVVPVDELDDPLTGLVFRGKWLAGVIRPILHRPEQRFRVRVVIADARPGERPEHAQFFQAALQRGRTHGVAVIGVQDQRLLSALTDPLSQASPTDQIRCNGWMLTLIHIPGHNLSAPDVDHQIEVQPDPAHGGGQIRDDPAPELVRSCGSEPWHASWFLWCPCSTAPVHLSMGMEHAVKAAL